MHKLIVHIGTGKTGSTSIQAWMGENNKILNENGYYNFDAENENIPSMRRKFRFTDSYKMAFRHMPYMLMAYPELFTNKEKNDFIKLIKKKLENYDVIISEEVIWGAYEYKADEILNWLKETFNVSIQVIVYIRREDSYMKSLTEYLKKALISNINCNITEDIYIRLKNIESIIGKDNLIVRPFEKEQLKNNDVVSDFLSLLNVNVKEVSYPRQNEKLQEELLYLKEVFNKEYLNAGGKINMWFELKCCQYFELMNNIPFVLSNNNADIIEKEIVQDYEVIDRREQYNKIAKEYFEESKEDLFINNVYKVSEQKLIISSREEEMIRVFARLLAEVENDAIHMHDKYDFLYRIKQYPLHGIFSYLFKNKKNKELLRKYQLDVIGYDFT